MTSILLPLGVVLNSSFQQLYDEQYDLYLDTALGDKSLRTKNGKTKIPSYSTESKWCSDFYKQYKSDLIVKAFAVCGIVGNDAELYNSKLKEVLIGNLSLLDAEVDEYFDDGQEFQNIDDENLFHQFESLFDALAFSVNQESSVLQNNITSTMKEDENYHEIVDEEDLEYLTEGELISEDGINKMCAFRRHYSRYVVFLNQYDWARKTIKY